MRIRNEKESARFPSGWIRICGILIVLGLFLNLSGQCAEYQHYWGHPSPQGNPVNGISFIDASTGFAVGDFGSVLYTTDGGLTWQTHPLPMTRGATAVLATRFGFVFGGASTRLIKAVKKPSLTPAPPYGLSNRKMQPQPVFRIR